MKGGKGGTGRKQGGTRPPEKSRNPHDGPKRGTPKKDWGAVEREEPTVRESGKGLRRPAQQ